MRITNKKELESLFLNKKIKIRHKNEKSNSYETKEGVITSIDDSGLLHVTWKNPEEIDKKESTFYVDDEQEDVAIIK